MVTAETVVPACVAATSGACSEWLGAEVRAEWRVGLGAKTTPGRFPPPSEFSLKSRCESSEGKVVAFSLCQIGTKLQED